MDLNAIKNRLNQLQTTNNRTSNLWKPQPGNQIVRIVPYKFNKDNPFIELYFHYDLGGKNYLSPMSFGRPDPIEEFAQKLKGTGSKDDYRLGRKVEAKMRTYAPVIVRGEENQGVKFWGFGKTVYQELLSIIADPDYGDITDLKTGTDVTVTCTKAPGQQWAKTEVLPKRKSSALSSDTNQVKEWLGDIPDVTQMFQLKSYDELSTIVNNWLEGDTKENEGSDWGTNTKSEETTTDNSSSYSSLDDAFSDLMK